ncbi:MAG: helix-turn-helix domain-containing protein [Nanobdellota archaeon]
MLKDQKKIVGENLKRIRKQKQYTQKEIATKIPCLTERRISNLENGRGKSIKPHEVEELVKTLNIKKSDIHSVDHLEVCPVCGASYPGYTKKFRESFPMTNKYHKLYHETDNNNEKALIAKQYAQYLMQAAEWIKNEE